MPPFDFHKDEQDELEYRQAGLDDVPSGTGHLVYAAIAAVACLLIAASIFA
jgi:hypothetical protein